MASKTDETVVMSYTLRTSRDIQSYINGIVSLYNNTGDDSDRFRHQGATAAILGPYTPYRGLVVAHELGTGKTMTSIRVTESSARTTWVVTKAALSAKNAISNAIRNLDAQDEDEVNKRYENLQQAFFTSDILKEKDGKWIGDKRLEYVNSSSNETKRHRIKRINDLYKFIHYNGGLSMLRDLLSDVESDDAEMTTVDRLFKVLRGDSPNPFDHHTVVVDECHNISEGILNTLDTQKSGIHWSSPPANYAALYALLTRAVDCKIVLLTATPIVNDSFSAALLCNLAAGHPRVIPVKRRSRDRDNRISLLKRVLAAMPNDWTSNSSSPIAININHTRGTRALIHIAPFGTRFKTITNPHVVETYVAEHATKTSSSRRTRWNKIVNTIKQACKIARLDILADEFDLPPFPSPISVKHNGALLFDTSSVETYHRMFDPAKGKSTAFVQGALGLVSRYKVPVDSSWANVTYHADKKKGSQKTKKTKDMSYMSCVMYSSHSRYYLNVKKKYTENSIVSVPTTQAALAHKTLVDELEDGTIATQYRTNSNKIDQKSVKYYRLLEILFGLKKPKKKGRRTGKLKSRRRNNAKKALIFCSLRKKGGVETIASLLKFYGMVEVRATSGEFTYHKWGQDDSEDTSANLDESHPAMRFAVYKGDMDKEARAKIINAYKRYDTSNTEDHKYEKQAFSILLMTTAGAEGLNTRAVEEVHVMTPFWHNVQLQQVVGRARRADSHSHWENKEKNIDVYMYIATARDLTTTTDEDMWRVAMLKLNVSNWVDKYGMELGSIDWWAKEDNSARQLTLLDTMKKYRSVARFKRGDSMNALLCDDYTLLKNKHAYLHTLKCAEYTSCASAAMISHGGIRRSFDGLREISATPRLLHGDIGNEPRYDATPWILPIINNNIRTHYDGEVRSVNYGYRMGEKFKDRKHSNFDTAIKEIRRIFQSMRWPSEEKEATREEEVSSVVTPIVTSTTGAAVKEATSGQSSEAATTGTTALLKMLYDASANPPEKVHSSNTDPDFGVQIEADAPLRLLFSAYLSQVTNSLDRNVNLAYFTRAITLSQQLHMKPVCSKYYVGGGAGQTGMWLDVMTNNIRRCDVWNAYGHHFRGPRPDLLQDGLRRASSFVQGCVRCSSNVMAGNTLSIDTQQVCTGKNKYEPVRECVSTDVLADMLPMVRTMLEFPPSMHNINPDIEGDTINLVNFLTFPVRCETSNQNINIDEQIIRPIRRFSNNKRSYWFEYHEPEYNNITSRRRSTTSLIMSSVTEPQITTTLKQSPWRRLLPDTSSLQTQLAKLIRISNGLLSLRSSQRSSIWHVAENLLMPYRTVLNELHPANKLRRLVRDLDAALRHVVVAKDNTVILTNILPVSQSSSSEKKVLNKFTRSLGYGVIPRETDVWYLQKYALEIQHSTHPSIHPDDVLSDIAKPGTIVTHNDVRTKKKKLSKFLTRLQKVANEYITRPVVPRNWKEVVRWAVTLTQSYNKDNTDNKYNKNLFNVLLFSSFIAPKLLKQFQRNKLNGIYLKLVQQLGLSSSGKEDEFFHKYEEEVQSTANSFSAEHPLWGLSSGNPFSGKAGDSIARARRKILLSIAAEEPTARTETSRGSCTIASVEMDSNPRYRYPTVLKEEIIQRRTKHPGAVSDVIINISSVYKEKGEEENNKRDNLAKMSCPTKTIDVETDCFNIIAYTNMKQIHNKLELSDHIDYVWKKYWGSKRHKKDDNEEDDVITGNVDEGGASDEESVNGDGNGEGPDEPDHAADSDDELYLD